MKIAIIGTGGVGGYFGIRLAQSGNEVRFLARGAHLEAIKQHGLHLKSISGDFHLKNAFVCQEISTIGRVDLVLVAVKSFQVKQLAPQLLEILHEDTIIIPLQNGVLAAKELMQFIPSKHVINGLCRIFSMIEKPGVIRHVGVEPTIIFGEADQQISERMKKLSMIFAEAGIKYKMSNDIEAELWKKFISICVSGLLAVTKSTYGDQRSDPVKRQQMTELIREGYELALKTGIRISPDYVEKAVAFIDEFDHDATASLTRDVWAGRPSEIEYQNGTIVHLAKAHGVNVPINTFVYETIKVLEAGIRE